jgi:hypothetical protein
LRETHPGGHRNHVRAERRELLLDRALRTRAQRQHRDHRGHTDDHAEHGERGAKQVAADGREGNAQDLEHLNGPAASGPRKASPAVPAGAA